MTARGLLLAAGVLLPVHLAAQSPDSARLARVVYVTGTSVYLDAGREHGLREGSRIELLRGAMVAAVLQVSFLSSRRAACALDGVGVAVSVGDTVRYAPAQAEPALAVRDSVPTRRAARTTRGGRLRGRVGARYLSVNQHGSPSHYSQPALDLRLDGSRLGGTGLGLLADVRARRVTGVHADGTRSESGRTRVYQASLSWSVAGTPLRFAAGRQFAPGASSVSLFDGVLAEVSTRRWAAGAFAGSEPDPVDLSLSGAVRDYGAYFEVRTPAGGDTRAFVRTGAVGSYQEGVANREFAYLQGGVSGRRLTLLATQEVDYYRAWKRDSGGAAVSPTSTFATVHYRPSDAVTVTAGIDNRRDVRLYRDVVTPETAFDDSFRHGAWVGLSLAPGRYRLSFDARSSSGGRAGKATAYTVSAGAHRLTRHHGEVRLRTTRYEGPRVAGWVHSLSVGAEPADWARLELSGGLRNEEDAFEAPASMRVTWATADLDLTLARAWYLLLSLTMERGDLESNDQVYGGLSYRF